MKAVRLDCDKDLKELVCGSCGDKFQDNDLIYSFENSVQKRYVLDNTYEKREYRIFIDKCYKHHESCTIYMCKKCYDEVRRDIKD